MKKTNRESLFKKPSSILTRAIMHKVIAESKTFSKILVAVDELKTSTASTYRAIDYAVNIAQDYNAKLIILHVIRADPRVHGINPPSHVIEMKKEAEANFAKMIEKIYENTDYKIRENLQIKTDIIASVRIADAIVSYAKDKGIDLIVTGTRGRNKIKNALLGSIASDVITSAHCPVLIAK
ncbi:MAG TPA: universal stress protein [Nitrososphaeraceae archaeon]|nr:universal stress protein [Nitrososphaeraceae archaeon]